MARAVCVDVAPDCVSASRPCEVAASCRFRHFEAGSRDKYIEEMVALDYQGCVYLLHLMGSLS